jgi:hypothetical protein
MFVSAHIKNIHEKIEEICLQRKLSRLAEEKPKLSLRAMTHEQQALEGILLIVHAVRLRSAWGNI